MGRLPAQPALGFVTTHRRAVAAYWDLAVNTWLADQFAMPEELVAWYGSYRGKGRGEPTLEGIPEPYGGDLAGIAHEPRMVLLGLNPGGFDRVFQSRAGLFADEIRQVGALSRWLITWPYLREPWLTEHPRPIPYVNQRVKFAQRWLGDPSASLKDLLTFEMYPWHSTGVTSAMTPPAATLQRFVWNPLSEFNVPLVWAFGKEWDNQSRLLGLGEVDRLGAGGRDYGSRVASRAVRVFALPSGQRLVVEWHSGGAGPPAADEIEILRQALT